MKNLLFGVITTAVMPTIQFEQTFEQNRAIILRQGKLTTKNK